MTKSLKVFLQDMSDMELLAIEQDVEQLIENFDLLSHHDEKYQTLLQYLSDMEVLAVETSVELINIIQWLVKAWGK